MLRRYLGVTLVFMTALVFAGLYSPDNSKNVLLKSVDGFGVETVVTRRESITFVLGEDSSQANSFYTQAAEHYYRHPDERTDYVITSCRAISEVQHYLAANPPGNGEPWGTINLVTHGNEWGGLAVPVVAGGARTTAATIDDAVATGGLTPLTPDYIDLRTEIRLQGCALGRQPLLLRSIARAFGELQPRVCASNGFVFYEATEWQGRVVATRQRLADCWYAFYRTGYRPGDIRLARQLQHRYPDAEVDWRQALNNNRLTHQQQLFHSTFTVPVRWTVTYPDPATVPDLSENTALTAWVDEEAGLQEYLKGLGLSADLFTWRSSRNVYTWPDGTMEDAVTVEGKCTVLCVLELPENDALPTAYNGRFWTAVRPLKKRLFPA